MDRFGKAFDGAHGIEFDAYRFDEPDYQALIVTEETYLEHLRVQAAGLAYYGTLAKAAERRCDDLEQRYRNRYNEMYTECSSILERSGKKQSVREIEAFVQCKYEKEIDKWLSELSSAKAERDGATMYYEAWKTKGFTLSSMTSLVTAGFFGPKDHITESDFERASERRMAVSEAKDILSLHRRNLEKS